MIELAVYDFKEIVLESYPVLLLATFIGLVAGLLLQLHSAQLTAIVLMMIPLLNGIGGNIGSILGARLSSALHIGTVEPKLRGQEVLGSNLLASAAIGMAVFTFSGLLIFLSAQLFGIGGWMSLRAALAFFIAGTMLVGIISFTVLAAAFMSYARGIDPDNVVIPLVTSVIDVAGVICLLIMVHILGV